MVAVLKFWKCLSHPRWIQMCTWFLISLLYSDKIRKTKKKITYTLYTMHCYFWSFGLLGMIHMNVMFEL